VWIFISVTPCTVTYGFQEQGSLHIFVMSQRVCRFIIYYTKRGQCYLNTLWCPPCLMNDSKPIKSLLIVTSFFKEE
jgi:hypothetical protein